jgi:hypothetical protein
MLDGLDDVDWQNISDAYGAARRIPAYLRDLASTQAKKRSTALQQLYMGICRESVSISQATQYAVPFLVELALNIKVPDRGAVLILLGHIAQAITPLEASGLAGKSHLDRTELDAQKEWLGHAKEEVSKGLEEFLNLLDDVNPDVRLGAGFAVSSVLIGGTPEFISRAEKGGLLNRAIQKLLVSLENDEDEKVRISDALVLGAISSTYSELLISPALHSAFNQDKSLAVKLAAAIALLNGPEVASEDLVNLLVKALQEHDKTEELSVESPYLEGNLLSAAFESLCRQDSARFPQIRQMLINGLKTADCYTADWKAAPILNGLFPAQLEKPNPAKLTEIQRLALQALVDNSAYWGPDSSGEFVLNRVKLPTTRNALKVFLGQR